MLHATRISLIIAPGRRRRRGRQTMLIQVNGQPQDLPEAVTVAMLLERMGIDARRAAVEVNRRLVRRAAHGQTMLAAGDAVEIVTLVGGG